jgi:3-hydroxybutyryl-CoA dehydrogenase
LILDNLFASNTPVGIVGAGLMGAGIAQVAATAGHPVRLFDQQPGAAARAIERIASDLAGAVERGKMDESERHEVVARVKTAVTLGELSRCALVVEAVVERLDVKHTLFRSLENIVAADTVLASNTSSISITSIAQGLELPGRVVGWHFFNPAPRMKLVEIVRGVETEEAVVRALHVLSERWGKTPVSAPNTPGFIVNRVARPYFGEGLRLLAEDLGGVAAIDRLMREAGGFAMGPFELMDLIGLDTNLQVTESIFAASQWDPRFAPHLLQQELVRAGHHGRKTGRGFYDHDPEAVVPTVGSAAPHGPPPTLRCSPNGQLLQPLIDRLRAAGLGVESDDHLRNRPGVMLIDDVDIMVTDGRTAIERASSYLSTGVLLLDLARDFATTKLVGATASVGAELSIHRLAAALAPAGIEVLRLNDVAGLGVMRTLACLANEAADMMTWTGATAADIDIAMVLGMSYPSGPLAWADQVGASKLVQVLENLQRHYGDARYRRSPRLMRAHFAQEQLKSER